MATCFLNNVYCCYLPSHCSHGLQPLDNSPFNVLKAAYRKELEKLISLTDSAPVDKVNFIRAYAKAREAGLTTENIMAGWRVTGNWPISRNKALRHPEIQEDKEDRAAIESPKYEPYLGSDDTPQNSRQIRDLAKYRTPTTRRRYGLIAKGFEVKEQRLVAYQARIASLEEEVARLKRGRKKRAIPNPNRRFMTLAEALVADEAAPEATPKVIGQEITVVDSDEDEESEIASEIEVKVAPRVAHHAGPKLPYLTTRSGRVVKKNPRYE